MGRIPHQQNTEDGFQLNEFPTSAPPPKPAPSQGLRPLVSRPGRNWSSLSLASSTDEGNLVGGWKTWTMKGPFFAIFVVICMAFIGVAEGLLRISKEGGSVTGIFGLLEDSTGKLPLRATCLFNYLPTLLSVLLGLLAARMDHDFKRLEPYFQLSQAAGADAANSLLLDYPYRFAIAVPFISFSRRHWSVFFSSTILVVILFVVTPLMSGLLERATIPRTFSDIATQAEVIPLERQESSFSTRFAYLAYQYTWRDKSALPKFTTADFAALPLDLNSIKAGRFQDREHWVVKTTKYEADLDCEEGVAEWELIQEKYNHSLVHITGTKSQCKYTLGFMNNERQLFQESRERLSLREAIPFHRQYSALLMNHKVNIRERAYNRTYYSLSAHNRAECDTKNIFLGIWAGQYIWSMDYSNGTWKGDKYVPHSLGALFCKPSYWKQEVEIKVSVETGAIANSTTIGEREPFTEFNREVFEDTVVTGRLAPENTIWNTLPGMADFGYFPVELPDAEYQLKENSGADWFLERSGVTHLNPRSLTSFAMEAEDPYTLPHLLYPQRLLEIYKKTFRLFFAIAVSEELVEYKESGKKIPIERVFSAEAFVIDKVWCRCLQTAFVFIIIWTGALYINARKRPINLDGDPSPLAVTMMTISTSYALHSDFQGTEFMSQSLLEEALLWKGHRYYLRLIRGIGPQIDRMKESTAVASQRSTRVLALPNSKEVMIPVKREPEWELTTAFGATVLACFLTLWIGIIYLFIYDRKHAGVPRIGGASSFVSRVLFTYLPTLVAVSIEPLWALLGRYACMVTPFEHLNRKGGMSRGSALTINYEGTPPHFQLRHAYSLKSSLVGVLAFAILFVNLLAVALSGLFEPLKVVRSVDDQYYNVKQPILWPQNISVPANERLRSPSAELHVIAEPEVFYVLWGNLSGHYELPQWTSEKYYFLPQVSTKYDSAVGHKEVAKRRVKTRGFGAEVKCKLLKNEDWDVTLNVSSNSYHAEIDDECARGIPLNRPYMPNVRDPVALGGGYEWSPAVWNSTDFIRPLANWSSPLDSKCWGNFIAGWGQSGLLPSGEFSKAEMVGLKCSQELRTVEAWVDVSPKEGILSVEPLPNTEQTLSDSFFSADALASAKKSEIPVQSSLDLSFQWGLANSAPWLRRTLGALSTGELDQSFDPHPLKWINHLMQLLDPAMNGKETHLPNEATLEKTFEKTITSLFAIYLSIHSHQLFLTAPAIPQPSSFSSSVFSSLFPSSSSSSDPTPTPIPGHTYIADDRITLSPAMFTIAIFIISFFILVTLLVYTMRPGKNLTHLPTTLAATYTLVYASNALGDLAGITTLEYKERLKAFEGLGCRYSYGEFMGGDGRVHFGVFKED